MKKRNEHKLKQAIYEHGYTIDSFCSKTGLGYSTLYNIFIGKTQEVRGDVINIIAKTLDLTYEEVRDMVKVQTSLF